MVPGPEVLLHPVVDPAVRQQLARSSDSLDRMGCLLSLMVLVRVRVLAFLGDSAGVGSLDPLFVGTAGGAVAMMG